MRGCLGSVVGLSVGILALVAWWSSLEPIPMNPSSPGYLWKFPLEFFVYRIGGTLVILGLTVGLISFGGRAGDHLDETKGERRKKVPTRKLYELEEEQRRKTQYEELEEQLRRESEHQEREHFTRQQYQQAERDRRAREEHERRRHTESERRAEEERRRREAQDQETAARNRELAWWEVLGVSRDASLLAIKESYRARLKEYHPDKVANLGSKLKEVAEFETKRLNQAYHDAMKGRSSK